MRNYKMSTKRKVYSADFKAKLVLQVLEGTQTTNEIASKYEILPTNLKNWKKMFLENMSLAFDKSAVVKEYKDEIEMLKTEKDSIAKKLGETIVKNDFLVEKLQSLVSSKGRKTFVDTKHELSLNKQCELLGIAKSTLYYTPVKRFSSEADIKFLNALNDIHSEFPYYGTRRLVTALENEGFIAGRKLIKSAMEYMGIRALYPKHKTTQAYNDLANEYGDIGGDGSANPIDMSGVPSNQSGFLSTLANVESGNKNITTPNKNGYVGIFQFRYRDGDHGSVLAKKMGVTPQQMINSPELQKKAMSLALNQYDRELSSSNIPVNNYTRWMRHNQGLGGTRAMTSGKLTPTIRRNIRNQGINGNNDYELIQNYHRKFKSRFV